MIERAVAVAVLVGCGVYLATGWSLPLGTAARPGPGFYPMAVGMFGASVALAWVVTAFRRAPAAASPAGSIPEGRGRVGTAAALLVGFCVLLPWLGYPLVAFLFTGLLLRGLGAKWPAALMIGLASAVASYYFFGMLLGVPLPRGPLLE
jgi:putative tricarboxylic transport membrane protein